MALIYDPSIDAMVEDGTGTGDYGGYGGGGYSPDYTGGSPELSTGDYGGYGGGGYSPDYTGGSQEPAAVPGSSATPVFSKAVGSLGDKAGDFLKRALYNPTTGETNLPGLATAGMGLYGLLNNGQSSGYTPTIPKLEMIRQQMPSTKGDSGGRRYFTDTQYVPQGDVAARDAALAAAASQAKGLPAPAEAQLPDTSNGMAQGGVAGLAKGGRYLNGKTDGMADEIPTTIDGKDKAALSHGEFVIPADVVSHLGNGNSEAGAQKLYSMMDRIRHARTGTKKQGKQINADKIIAASTGGGIGFAVGGAIPQPVSATQTPSPWAGDYVTTALGQGAAAANAPYQAYGGPLTAGPSALQQQQFAGISNLAKTPYTPATFSSGTFDAGQAQKYMNPYLQQALDPQMKEMARQAEIQRVQDAGRLTKAGAFGGSRQAIMESEGARNLLDRQTSALGTGYKSAFDTAMGQFNTEQGRNLDVQRANEASRQYGSEFGLRTLGALGTAGATQRDISGERIAADKAAFEQERDWAYKMPQYQLDLLRGLPFTSTTTATNPDAMARLSANTSDLAGLYKLLSNLGVTPPAATPPAATPPAAS